MRILAVDPGTKRIGIAVSDPTGLIATPLTVLPRKDAEAEISKLVVELEVELVIVGIPRGLGGNETQSGRMAREFVASLTTEVDVPIEEADERFTSRIAEEALLEAGVSRRDRRASTDKVAAAVLLQSYLDSKRHHLDRGSDQTDTRSRDV